MRESQEQVGRNEKDSTKVAQPQPQWQFNCCELPNLAGNPRLVAGVDEVGRGALFGPVVAAAVILPTSTLPKLAIAGIKDSKQLSPLQRLKLAQEIKASALDWRIGYASSQEIDQLNIFQASLLAMKRGILKLNVKPDICLVDGKHLLPDLPLPQQTLIKGDQRSLEIAAASIVATVWRDDLVMRLAIKYPNYDLVANKGYGTQKHRLALQQYGPSRLHRMSFSPCQARLKVVSLAGHSSGDKVGRL